MAQFRATIRGRRGGASRLGDKRSGILATVNGWQAGVMVQASHDTAGRDCFRVFITGGSAGPIREIKVAEIIGSEIRTYAFGQEVATRVF